MFDRGFACAEIPPPLPIECAQSLRAKGFRSGLREEQTLMDGARALCEWGMSVKLAGFRKAEEVEGFSRLEIFDGVAGEDVSLVGAEVELHDLTGFVGEVDLFEIDPEGVGGQGGFEEVKKAFVIGYGAPSGGGDVRPLPEC